MPPPWPPRSTQPGGTSTERTGRPSAEPGAGSGPARRQMRSSQAWRLYPANSSSPPSPDRATVTSVRASLLTRCMGIAGDVAEGLVPDVGQERDELGSVRVAHVERGVIGPEVRGHRGGVGRFVEGAVGEADGEGAHRPAAVAAA